MSISLSEQETTQMSDPSEVSVSAARSQTLPGYLLLQKPSKNRKSQHGVTVLGGICVGVYFFFMGPFWPVYSEEPEWRVNVPAHSVNSLVGWVARSEDTYPTQGLRNSDTVKSVRSTEHWGESAGL